MIYRKKNIEDTQKRKGTVRWDRAFSIWVRII